MNLPFENDTNRIIKKLADRSLQSERRRNIMIIIAISLSAFLMSMCGAALFSFSQSRKNLSDDTFEVTYSNCSRQDIQGLKSLPEIERVAVTYPLAEWMNEKGDSLSLTYMDTNAIYITRKQFRIIEGEAPKAGEIAVSENYLKKYAPLLGIGDTLTLTASGRQSDFVISAILSFDNTPQNTYGFLTSLDYVKSYPGYNPKGFQAYAHFKNTNTLSFDELKTMAKAIGDKYGLEFEYSFLYLQSKQQRSVFDYLPFLILALIVLFSGITVIQSIFQISVNDKIKQYGQLRTLGATKKQIKQIVERESRKLMLAGIPAGIVFGNITGTILGSSKNTSGFHLPGIGAISVIVAAICWLMVHISVRKSQQTASGASPLDAVRYNPYEINSLKAKKSNHKITPVTLALMNLGRDRKKTASMLLSLSFGSILLFVSASLFTSYSAESYVRETFFSHGGNYRIYLNDYQLDVTEQIKGGNPLNDKFKRNIQSIDGVKDVIPIRSSVGQCSFSTGSYSDKNILCDILTDITSEGNASYIDSLLIAGHMPQSDTDVLFSDAYQSLQPGDNLELTVNGNTASVTISGIYDGTYAGTANGNAVDDAAYILITEELAEKLLPSANDYSYAWEIITLPEKDTMVLKELEYLCSSAPSGILISLFSQEVDYMKGQMNLLFGGISLLSWLIFLYGIVNLVNITLSNQISRHHENSIMRSVGLTQRQMYRLFIIEGLSCIAINIIIMLAAGIPLSMILCKYMGSLIGFTIMPYQFPFMQTGAYILVLAVLQVILSSWSMKNMSIRPLAEQLRAVQ